MKIKQISNEWARLRGNNLEIGNFGNDEAVPESVFIEGSLFEDKVVPGSIIVKDEIHGNLAFKDIKVKGNTKIVNRVQGMIHMDGFDSEGFLFLYKDNLRAGFVARNCGMKGIFFFEGQRPFWLVELSNSKFQYLFLKSPIYKLFMLGITVEKLVFGKNFRKWRVKRMNSKIESIKRNYKV